MSVAFQPVELSDIQGIIDAHPNMFENMGQSESSTMKVFKTNGITMTFYGRTKTLLLQGMEDKIKVFENVLKSNGMQEKRKKKRARVDERIDITCYPKNTGWKEPFLNDIKTFFTHKKCDLVQFKSELNAFVANWQIGDPIPTPEGERMSNE